MRPYFRLYWITGISALFLYAGSKFLDHGLRVLYQHSYSTVDHILKKNEQYSNTIILGNSIIKFGVNPYYIDSIAGVNSFNLGYPASGFITEALFLRKYIDNYGPPENLILGFNQYKFYLQEEKINKYPLYDFLNDPDVLKYFDHNNLPYWRIKHIPLYKYTTLDDYSRFGVFSAYRGTSAFQLPGSYNYKGFYSNLLNGNKNIQFAVNITPKNYVFQAKEYEAFNDIINLCTIHKINLLLVLYPGVCKQVISNVNLKEADSIIKNLDKNNKIHFLTDFNCEFKESDFIDEAHLTFSGSVVYSIEIAEELKRLLRNQKNN